MPPINSAIVSSQFVRAMLDDDTIREIDPAEAAPGDVVVYFHKEAVTHAAVVVEEQTYRSKWGGNEVHQHGLWEVPAQYGDRVRYYRAPEPSIVLTRLPDPM